MQKSQQLPRLLGIASETQSQVDLLVQRLETLCYVPVPDVKQSCAVSETQRYYTIMRSDDDIRQVCAHGGVLIYVSGGGELAKFTNDLDVFKSGKKTQYSVTVYDLSDKHWTMLLSMLRSLQKARNSLT